MESIPTDYPLRKSRKTFRCYICETLIMDGEYHYSVGNDKRAHQHCAQSRAAEIRKAERVKIESIGMSIETNGVECIRVK